MTNQEWSEQERIARENQESADSDNIIAICSEAFKDLRSLPLKKQIEVINAIRRELHQYSPFKTEPVDCVQWVDMGQVDKNQYNPNSVAPPEMKLLELSIKEDGYTQPIVAWNKGDEFEVVDGFHRNRVGKESKDIKRRIHGYLPLVIINQDRTDVSDRMASTIRHNRARGKHSVDSMSDIVVELKKRNRSEDWIAKHLGMDSDEVLRLCQISGLTEMFSNSNFSKAWDVDISQDVGTLDIEEELSNE